MSPHFRHRRMPRAVVLAELGDDGSAASPSSTTTGDTSTGRAPMGTAPGSVVQATNREIKAIAAAGQYTDEKKTSETKLSETSFVLITYRAKIWIPKLKQMQRRPDTSRASHRLARKVVPKA